MVLMVWGERGENVVRCPLCKLNLSRGGLAGSAHLQGCPTNLGPPLGGTRQDKLHGPVVEQPEQKPKYWGKTLLAHPKAVQSFTGIFRANTALLRVALTCS